MKTLKAVEPPKPAAVLNKEQSEMFLVLANQREQIDAQLRALVLGLGLKGQFYSMVENGQVRLFKGTSTNGAAS